MKLKPVSDHIILKAVEKEKTTASGIIIPETADKERPEKGEVIAVGPGKILENGDRQQIEIKVGDTVIFKKYAPDEVKIDGEEYLVIRESDVVAIVLQPTT